MVIAWTVFHENFDRRILIGALAILAGAILLSWQGASCGIGLGALAIAGACLAWGIDNNLTRKISSADPVQIAMLKGLVSGGVNICLAIALGAHAPPLGATLAAGLVGLLGYGVSLVLFVLALRHVGAARTGAYFSTAPFIGATVGVVLLSEPITVQLVGAAVLMTLGVYLHLAERHEHEHEHEHTHEPLEHEHAHSHDAHHQHAHASNDPAGEPHTHRHSHAPLIHRHPHFPDLHHGHRHH